MTVITRGISDNEGPERVAFESEHRQTLLALMLTSRRGQLIVAGHSGHHVQLDEPQLVIKAIQDVVAASAVR